MKSNKAVCVLTLIFAATSLLHAQTNAPGSAVWTGKGDGKNWSDARNWHPNMVPTNTATIGEPDEPRVIVVDKAAQVDVLRFGPVNKNTLLLQGGLTVRSLVMIQLSPYEHANIDVGNHTLTLSESTRSYLPKLRGKGLFVKTGTGTCYAPTDAKAYSGDYVVRSGTLVFWGGNMGAGGSTNLTIHNGATVRVMNPSPEPVSFPSNVVVYGVGEGDGVLSFDYSDFGFASNLRAASDAKVSAKANVTWHGHIRGPGMLTFEAAPGKTNRLDGVFHCAVNGPAANRMAVGSGALDIVGCALTVEGSDTATTEEYVLIDYSSEDGSLTGRFATTISMPKRWFVAYAGTADNPKCVVLVNPPAADAAVTIP